MKTCTLVLLLILPVFAGFSQEKLEPEGDIPILAWVGVPEAETTVERFRELKEAGININFSSYSDIGAVEKALEIAQQTGVKLLPYCPELKSDPEKTVTRLMKHPALAGYRQTNTGRYPASRPASCTGTLVRADAYAARTEVDPGDAVIFTWEKSNK